MKAISIGEPLFNKLRKNFLFSGCIHSLFSEVCNINIDSIISDRNFEQLNSSNRFFITLTSELVGQGPFNIVLDSRNWKSFFSQIKIGNKVKVSLNNIFISSGNIVFFNKTYKWKAEVSPFKKSDLFWLNKNISKVRDYIPEKRLNNSFQVEIESAQKQFTESILKRDFFKFKESAQSLCGLGPGLTPAGDDFLAGFMIGVITFQYIFLDYNLAEEINQSILKFIQSRTHILSLNFLKLASQGLVTERVKDFLKALISSSQTELLEKCNRLFLWGSTSGIDLATGVISAYEVLGSEVWHRGRTSKRAVCGFQRWS